MPRPPERSTVPPAGGGRPGRLKRVVGTADEGWMTRTARLLAVLLAAALLVVGVGRIPSAVANRAEDAEPAGVRSAAAPVRASRGAPSLAGAAAVASVTTAASSPPQSLPVEDGTPQPVVDHAVLPVNGAP